MPVMKMPKWRRCRGLLVDRTPAAAPAATTTTSATKLAFGWLALVTAAACCALYFRVAIILEQLGGLRVIGGGGCLVERPEFREALAAQARGLPRRRSGSLLNTVDNNATWAGIADHFNVRQSLFTIFGAGCIFGGVRENCRTYL